MNSPSIFSWHQLVHWVVSKLITSEMSKAQGRADCWYKVLPFCLYKLGPQVTPIQIVSFGPRIQMTSAITMHCSTFADVLLRTGKCKWRHTNQHIISGKYEALTRNNKTIAKEMWSPSIVHVHNTRCTNYHHSIHLRSQRSLTSAEYKQYKHCHSNLTSFCSSIQRSNHKRKQKHWTVKWHEDIP